MAVPELAIVRAVVAYVFRDESAKHAARREGISAATMRRWLASAGLHVRSSVEQRALDKVHGRYDHADALRVAWCRGNFDTDTYRKTRPKGDWGFPRDGEHNPFFGHSHSSETREALSKGARARAIGSIGEYGPEWTEDLRASIVARDGNACLLCRSTEVLQVHHIDLDRGNSHPRNLLTLCAACHLGYNGRGERADEIAAAHAAMLVREFYADGQGRPSC
jgi:hypothetical protein